MRLRLVVYFVCMWTVCASAGSSGHSHSAQHLKSARGSVHIFFYFSFRSYRFSVGVCQQDERMTSLYRIRLIPEMYPKCVRIWGTILLPFPAKQSSEFAKCAGSGHLLRSHATTKTLGTPHIRLEQVFPFIWHNIIWNPDIVTKAPRLRMAAEI